MGKTKEEVVNLIRQLKALADKTVYEAEAEIALSKMQELLLRYNLQLEDIALDVEAANGHLDIREVTLDLGRWGTSRDWKKSLLFEVAKWNFCSALVSDRAGTLIGTKDNIEAVKEMFEYIVEQLEAIAQAEFAKLWRWEEGRWVKDTPYHGKTWKLAFLAGAVDRMSQRLYENWARIKAEEEAKAPQQTQAIILVHETAIGEYIKKTRPKLGTFRPSYQSYGGQAYNAGHAAADGVIIARPAKQIEGK